MKIRLEFICGVDINDAALSMLCYHRKINQTPDSRTCWIAEKHIDVVADFNGTELKCTMQTNTLEDIIKQYRN